MDTSVNTDKKYDYATDAIRLTNKIKQEVAAHEKLTQENNDLSKYFRMIQSGMYSKSDLKKFLSLSPSKYALSGAGNGILKAEQLSYINKIMELAQAQTDSLDGFDVDVRFEDIKDNYGAPVTKEHFELAQTIHKQLIDNGDHGISFNDVLAEVQSGKLC